VLCEVHRHKGNHHGTAPVYQHNQRKPPRSGRKSAVCFFIKRKRIPDHNGSKYKTDTIATPAALPVPKMPPIFCIEDQTDGGHHRLQAMDRF
jgi:hypothetical protein